VAGASIFGGRQWLRRLREMGGTVGARGKKVMAAMARCPFKLVRRWGGGDPGARHHAESRERGPSTVVG
jgi:hypothetical protein